MQNATETLTRPAPVETVTPIRPSEALRLGRLVRPIRCQGEFFRGDNAACAAGAIAVGWGHSGVPDLDDGRADWQWIEDRLGRFGLKLWGDIAEYFDKGATDDQIVARLEARGL